MLLSVWSVKVYGKECCPSNIIKNIFIIWQPEICVLYMYIMCLLYDWSSWWLCHTALPWLWESLGYDWVTPRFHGCIRAPSVCAIKSPVSVKSNQWVTTWILCFLIRQSCVLRCYNSRVEISLAQHCDVAPQLTDFNLFLLLIVFLLCSNSY
jgi:hypothetical protein